ncbi:Uncharacterized protein GY17_00002902 [Cryptosporidium hominis]|uniref:Uncharacterized protein n=1 Tax=Cryptosporidium hominis TaxID=237895 RepID=A0ABX5BAJ9_CRYHO|nr:Uncharacterized protein GY17_00002902 [Cryptosporidium hominis]|eukprot:PPS94122.1 Uncharacterized protein GY17_00002902 [Cryptosporidium hominis]
MELLLNSINYKIVIITLINGSTIQESNKSPNFNANYNNFNTLFIPIKSIHSLTCPEVDNPSKHIRMYLKSSILLNMKN